MIIDGKKIAQEIIDGLKLLPKPDKFLAAVLVGKDAASVNFLKQKEKTAKELGIDFRLYEFPEDSKNDDLRKEILKIAQHKTCGGVIVQLPLPEQINRHYVLNVIPRGKDPDVLGERALGAFYAGRNPVLPPAVGTVEMIISNLPPQRGEARQEGGKIQILNLKAAVVGRGFLIGKPIALWLMDKVRELAVFGSKSDISNLKNFDLVISGVGKAGIIKPETLKENATIIDFGYDIDSSGKIHGDFDISKAGNLSYTPTPGGTGPILVAKLLENFYRLNSELQQGKTI